MAVTEHQLMISGWMALAFIAPSVRGSIVVLASDWGSTAEPTNQLKENLVLAKGGSCQNSHSSHKKLY